MNESTKFCKQCGIKLSKLSKDEGFCVECATPIEEKAKAKIKESKFEKYLIEKEKLDENIEIASLMGDKFKPFQQLVVQELGKGLPKSIPKSSIEALIKDAKNKGNMKLVTQLSYFLDK